MAKNTKVNYNPQAQISCSSCSSVYSVGATFDILKIDICGNCHPVYTGKSILIDTAGQLKKFQDRVAKTDTGTSTTTTKKVKARRTKQTFADIEAA